MNRHLIREYATLLIKTLGVQAFADVGDVQEGFQIVRRELVAQLRASIPKLTRVGLGTLLGVKERAIDDWWSQARKLEAEDAQGSEDADARAKATEDLRFFLGVMQLLCDAGEEFTSLGKIVDHVKATVNRGYTTRDVEKRLEAYVGRGKIERAPHDPELFRLSVRIPAWTEQGLASRSALLELMFSVLYEIGFQIFVDAKEGEARIQIYDIPESRKAAFTEAYVNLYLKFLESLEELEAGLQRDFPSEPRTHLALLFISGRITGQKFAQLKRRMQQAPKEIQYGKW